MDLSNYAVVLPVVIMCYLIGVACKAINGLDNKYIPIIVGVSGAVLGVLGWYVIPEYPANDIMTAIAVGIMSGLTSTGVNQIYKQMSGD